MQKVNTKANDGTKNFKYKNFKAVKLSEKRGDWELKPNYLAFKAA